MASMADHVVIVGGVDWRGYSLLLQHFGCQVTIIDRAHSPELVHIQLRVDHA